MGANSASTPRIDASRRMAEAERQRTEEVLRRFGSRMAKGIDALGHEAVHPVNGSLPTGCIVIRPDGNGTSSSRRASAFVAGSSHRA